MMDGGHPPPPPKVVFERQDHISKSFGVFKKGRGTTDGWRFSLFLLAESCKNEQNLNEPRGEIVAFRLAGTFFFFLCSSDDTRKSNRFHPDCET